MTFYPKKKLLQETATALESYKGKDYLLNKFSSVNLPIDR